MPSSCFVDGIAGRLLWHPSINVALKTVQLHKEGKLIFESKEPTESGVIRFSEDGVHPLQEGHKIYSDLICDAITSFEQSAIENDHSVSLDKPFCTRSLGASENGSDNREDDAWELGEAGSGFLAGQAIRR